MTRKLLPGRTEATYAERMRGMARKARGAAVREMEKYIVKARGAMTKGQISGINFLRLAGEKANQAAGRQMLFNLEGLEFCRKEILPLLKCGVSLKEIQLAVHIRSRLEKPIETAEELKAFKAECRQSQILMGFADESTHEGQSLIEHNLFCSLTTSARKFMMTLESLEKQKPMAEWPPEALQEFLDDAKPMLVKIKLAEELQLKS